MKKIFFFSIFLVTATLKMQAQNGQITSIGVGSRVEVFFKDPVRGDVWLPAIILKVQTDGKYFVNYDDYAESYDEAVDAGNIRPMNLNIQGKVQYIPAIKGQVVSVNGNLSQGNIMEDLEWAENSSNACWVGIRNVEFEGNHVFYWFDLPKKSTVKITVIPKGDKPRVNIYGFVSFDFKFIPPDLPRCISCEAGFQQWVSNNMPDFTKSSGEQSIEFNTISSRMKVFVAVAGAKKFTSGDYELKVEIK
jgi:Agenet domain